MTFGGAVARIAVDGGDGERRPVSLSDHGHGYCQSIDTTIEAGRLGYHSLFLVEHHITGTAQISSSLNLLTYLAACTRTIRLAAPEDGAYVFCMASDPDLQRAAEQGTLIGSPGDIIDRIRPLHDDGVRHILLTGVLDDPGQLRIFADEVMADLA